MSNEDSTDLIRKRQNGRLHTGRVDLRQVFVTQRIDMEKPGQRGRQPRCARPVERQITGVAKQLRDRGKIAGNLERLAPWAKAAQKADFPRQERRQKLIQIFLREFHPGNKVIEIGVTDQNPIGSCRFDALDSTDPLRVM